MRTVGQILKETRENKLYTLGDIEKNTKIRKELLEALENDDYSKLPPSTFVQGFIKNYGKFLGLDADKLLAVFRRGFEDSKHPPKVLQSFSNPINNRKIRLTPGKLVGVVVGIVIILFFAYLWVEYRSFVGAPNLEVSSPADQQTVDIPQITVTGSTDPEVKVKVNDQQIGVDSTGHFNEDVKLSSSENTITITASSRFGQTAKITRTVFVKK
jgi:cytoskeletal protein RodZ